MAILDLFLTNRLLDIDLSQPGLTNLLTNFDCVRADMMGWDLQFCKPDSIPILQLKLVCRSADFLIHWACHVLFGTLTERVGARDFLCVAIAARIVKVVHITTCIVFRA